MKFLEITIISSDIFSQLKKDESFKPTKSLDWKKITINSDIIAQIGYPYVCPRTSVIYRASWIKFKESDKFFIVKARVKNLRDKLNG